MATFYEASKAKEQVADSLLKQSGILGVGVGYYNPKNPKDGAGIIIYSQKAAAQTMSIPNIVSATVKGKSLKVPVRIVKNNLFKPNLSIKASRFTRRIRPVQAGYSVGTPRWSGTGGIVVKNSNGTRLFLLSNNHVLNKNNSSGYTETTQPGGADGGRSVRDRIGRLYSYVKLKKTNNYIDGAISIPTNNKLLSTSYAILGKLKGHYVNYRVGSKFVKVGRTSGLVGGWVESINTDVKVNYGSYGGLGEILFRNQTIIKSNMPISLPGDSGSVWVDYKTKYAAAVNYAGTQDGKLSVSYPIHWAMQAFKINVATLSKSNQQLSVQGNDNKAYTRPLTANELKAIEVIKNK